MKCVVCGKGITRRFTLCAACLEIYGHRKGWPEWLKFLASDADKEKRQLAKAPDRLPEGYEQDDGGAAALDALSTVRMVELFKDSGLTKNEIAIVALRIFGGFSQGMIADTGGWGSQQTVGSGWRNALKKMRKTLLEAEMEKYQVRVAVNLTWQNIDAPDRIEAQKIAEGLTRRLVGRDMADAPEGVCLGDDVTISTTSIQGPSRGRRPERFAWQGLPEGASLGSAAPLRLGGTP